MEQLQSLSLAQKLILGGAVLLLIDTFFAWQSVEFQGVELASQNAWHGFWGVVLGLLVIVLLAWGIARIAGVQLPENMQQGLITLVLGVLILVFAVLKNLIDDYSAWASYVGIVLAAVIAYGAWRNFQESGESLPSMPRTAAAGAGASGAGTAAAPPPVESEPPPPPAEDGDQN
jgi:hypothetical protein